MSLIPRNRLGQVSDADLAREVGCARSTVTTLRQHLRIPAYVPRPLDGADLTRPTAELCAAYHVTARTVRAARAEAGIEVGPKKRGPRPPGVKVERVVNPAPVAAPVVAAPVVATAAPGSPWWSRPRSDADWEREPALRRSDR